LLSLLTLRFSNVLPLIKCNCSGPFGSHVIEKLLTSFSTAALNADEADYATAEAALTAFTDTAATSLYDMITSKYGSFVGRRLLSVLCGQDVTTPPNRKPGIGAPTNDGGDGGGGSGGAEGNKNTNAGTTGGGRKYGGLVSRVSNPHANGQGGTAATAHYSNSTLSFPQLVIKLANTVISDDWTGPDLSSVQCDPYAGPFLQSLLRATVVIEDEQLAGRLVIHLLGGNAASGPDSVTSDAMYRLLTDRNGSHLMEAAFEASPDDVLQKLCTAAFKGRLLSLAQHPSANFAVQAALASVRRPQQLKRMFEDLRPHMSTLLRARRGGVVAVLLAAAGRVGCLEADCADALWHSVESGLESSAALSTPLHKVLTLDTTITDLNKASGTGVRLSSLGCATLVTLLRYPAAACKKWADALSNLTPSELGAIARDPGGCRVIETYLEGPGGAPKKGGWVNAASTMAGIKFIEKCYDLAEADEKEVITAELAAAEDRVGATSRGAMLLQRCNVDAFKRGGKDWQRRVQATQEVRKEFEDLFGDDGGAADDEDEEGEEEEGAGAELVEETKKSDKKEKARKDKDTDEVADAAAQKKKEKKSSKQDKKGKKKKKKEG
jgi:nucleolar protein 9